MTNQLSFDRPISPSVSLEFLRACDSISYYLGEPKPIGQCLSTIHASFSPSTCELYKKQIEVVMSTAQRLLQRKAARLAPSLTLSRYLSSCLRRFSHCSDLPVMTPEQNEEYWENKWKALMRASELYKQDRLASGESEAKLDDEISRLRQQAAASRQRETPRAISLLHHCKEIRLLFPKILFSRPFTVDELDRLVRVRSLLESIPQGSIWCQEILRQLVSMTPNTDGLLQESVRFMLPYLYPGAFETATTIFKDLLRADSFGDTEEKFLATAERVVSSSLSSFTLGTAQLEPERLKNDLYLSYQRLQPYYRTVKQCSLAHPWPFYSVMRSFLNSIDIPPLINAIHPDTLRLLKKITFEEAMGFFTALTSLTQATTPAHELAHLLDDASVAYRYMRVLGIVPRDINSALSFAAKCAHLERTTSPLSFTNPFFLFKRFSRSELDEFLLLLFLEQSPALQTCLARFFLHGGKSIERFEVIKPLFDSSISTLPDGWLPLLISFSDGEVEDFKLFFHSGLLTPLCIHEIEDLIHDRACCAFIKRAGLLDSRDPLMEILELYNWLQAPDPEFRKEIEDAFWACFTYLTPEERYIFAYCDRSDSSSFFCCSEAVDHLEEDIASVALSDVPIGPLIRFLGSKPFPEMKEWLETRIPLPHETLPRIQTLTDAQRHAIISSYPLPHWIGLLGISDTVARTICHQEESRATPELAAFHAHLQVNIDGSDPLSLLSRVAQFFEQNDNTVLTAMKIVAELLLQARAASFCGQGLLLTWGNVEGASSHCVSQESPPVFTQDSPLYCRDLFNDIGFSGSAGLLRRRLIALSSTAPARFNRLFQALSPDELITEEEKELFFELLRLAENLLERYPTLSDYNRDHSPEAARAHPHFLPYFQALYRSGIPYGIGYDCNSYSHRHAFTFLALLQAARKTVIRIEKGRHVVTIDNTVSFYLQEIPREKISFPSAKNFGSRDLDRVVTDYPFHTLSPMTPRDVSPGDFARFATAIKSLSEEQFSALCQSCTKLLSMEFPDTSTTLDYCEAWEAVWPQGVDISSVTHVLVGIANQYITKVDRYMEPLLPNHTYHFNLTGCGAFCPESEVPDFLRVLGNFGSLMCASYKVVKPEDSSGSCGVNAFLLGMHGVDAYRQEGRDLRVDISQFRAEIVAYASSHKEELEEEFGKRAIGDLIAKYSTLEADWSGREVWAIAARKYGHPIHIFTCGGHGDLFRTNESGVIVPFDEETEKFYPKEPSTKPAIRLVLDDIHYYVMEPKT